MHTELPADLALDLDELAAELATIPRLFGLRARFEALVELAHDGLPDELIPLALRVIDTALADAPREQRWAVWELAAAATDPAWVVALLRQALHYSPLADDRL